MKGPTSPVRENISPVREQRKSPVRELSLSPVREDQVRLTSKTGKKRQCESNNHKKRKNIRPSEEIFNQYASQTNGYDSESERESQSVQSLNFDKAQKIDNQCEMSPALSPRKVLEDQSSKPQEILIPTSEKSLKNTPQNFHGGQIAEHIQERPKLPSDKLILQMVRRDTIEFEN